jgi:hypothetical protein
LSKNKALSSAKENEGAVLMALGLAAALFVILAGGLVVLLCLSSRKKNRRQLIAGASVLAALLLALAVYIALAFLLLDAVSNESQPSGNGKQRHASSDKHGIYC